MRRSAWCFKRRPISPARLPCYREGLAIRKALAQKDPGNTQWQRALAVGDDKIGSVLQAQSELAGALASYRDGLAISKTLAQKDPGNTLLQLDLAVSDNSIGDVLQAQGDRGGAITSYREALAISETLAQNDPSNAVWQTSVVLSLNRLAGAGDDPRANLSEALVIVKRLRANGKLSPALENLITRIEAALANIAN